MKYKISLSTYNLDIVEAFSALGYKKSQYIEQALINFVGTTKGKDTLRLMVEHGRGVAHNAAKGKRIHSEQKDRAEEGLGRISVDNFLQ